MTTGLFLVVTCFFVLHAEEATEECKKGGRCGDEDDAVHLLFTFEKMAAKDFQIIYDETRRAVARALSPVHIQDWRTCDTCKDKDNNKGLWYCAASPAKDAGQNCEDQSLEKDYIIGCKRKKTDECDQRNTKCPTTTDNVCKACEQKEDGSLSECSWLSKEGLVIQWSQIKVETIGDINVKDGETDELGKGTSYRCKPTDQGASSDDDDVKVEGAADGEAAANNDCSTAILDMRVRDAEQSKQCREMGTICEWVPRITAIQMVINYIPELTQPAGYEWKDKTKEWKQKVANTIEINKEAFKEAVEEFIKDQLEITGKYEGALDPKMVDIKTIHVDKWTYKIYPLTNLAIADNMDKEEGKDVIYISIGVMGGLMFCICSIALIRKFTSLCHYDNCCFRAVQKNEEGEYLSHGMTLTRSMTTQYDHPSMFMEYSNIDTDRKHHASDLQKHHDDFFQAQAKGEWAGPNCCTRFCRAIIGKKNTFNRGLYIHAKSVDCGPTEKFRQNTLYSDPEGTRRSSFITGALMPASLVGLSLSHQKSKSAERPDSEGNTTEIELQIAGAKGKKTVPDD